MQPPVPDAVLEQVLDDGSGRHHSARTKARKAALDALYDADITGRHPLDLLAKSDDVRPLTREAVAGVAQEVAGLDARVAKSLTGDWSLTRMPAIDRSLARLATWELLHTATPPAVVISEAVALADEYSTDGSADFLSSVLGQIADQIESPIEAGATPVPVAWEVASLAPGPDEMSLYLLDGPEVFDLD